MKGQAINYEEIELKWIEKNRELARKLAHEKFCKKFNRVDVSLGSYKALCIRRGWKTGRTGCIAKGAVPHNKGKKVAFNANSARTRFKKGRLPRNVKDEGHERLSKDGYIEVSIGRKTIHNQCGFHILKHLYLWEQNNGTLPEGMCLKCLDGNRQNTDPSNWEAIHRGALPFLNGHRGYNYEETPAELKAVVLTLAKVKYAKSKTINS